MAAGHIKTAVKLAAVCFMVPKGTSAIRKIQSSWSSICTNFVYYKVEFASIFTIYSSVTIAFIFYTEKVCVAATYLTTMHAATNEDTLKIIMPITPFSTVHKILCTRSKCPLPICTRSIQLPSNTANKCI